MIESIVELREFMKEEYPNATEEESVYYMQGYFKGIEDARKDVLKRMKQNGKDNDDRITKGTDSPKTINVESES